MKVNHLTLYPLALVTPLCPSTTHCTNNLQFLLHCIVLYVQTFKSLFIT